MLAANVTEKDIVFPIFVSPKLDGVRAIIKEGKVLSRSLKPIPNKFVQAQFGIPELEGLDGELIIGYATDKDVYRKTVSGVMTEEGEPEVWFHIFDRWNSKTEEYIGRMSEVCKQADSADDSLFTIVPSKLVDNKEQLLDYETQVLAMGFEGVILRSVSSPYKFGRSTVKEQTLLKLKRFKDSEAEILDFVELLQNNNEAKTDELGHTKRSSHKANKVPKAMLGALKVKDCYSGVEFEVGTGFSHIMRQSIWETRDIHKGMIIKYKYMDIGTKDKPRHPVFLGLRDVLDMEPIENG